MTKRTWIVSTAVGASLVTAVGASGHGWKEGVVLGGSVGFLIAFLEHLRSAREELSA